MCEEGRGELPRWAVVYLQDDSSGVLLGMLDPAI